MLSFHTHRKINTAQFSRMDPNQNSHYDHPLESIGGKSSRSIEGSLSVAPGTFTIATPAVTTILPMTENMNDSSFLLQAASYQQNEPDNPSLSDNSKPAHQSDLSKNVNDQPDSPKTERQDVSRTIESTSEKGVELNVTQSKIAANDYQAASNEDGFKQSTKKRSKVSKKSTKLDAKSKLEKSRQSARECRARKKLRYQYLEDLVCNREKAVVKLREEFSTFCELSKRIDVGTITESDRRLLTDQSKENSQNETTGIL